MINSDSFIINKEDISNADILKRVMEIIKFRNEFKIICGTNYQQIGRSVINILTFMNDENTSAFAWIKSYEKVINRKKELPFCPKCNTLLDNYKCIKCKIDFNGNKKDIVWKGSGKDINGKKVEGRTIKMVEFKIQRDARHIIENG